MDCQASDVITTYARAVELYDSNRLNEARELFEGIVAREPENTAALIGLGMTCWRGEAFHEARRFLEFFAGGKRSFARARRAGSAENDDAE